MSDTPLPDEPTPEVALEASERDNPDVYLWLIRLEEVRAQVDLLVEEARNLTMALERTVPKRAVYTDAAGIPWQATVVRPDDTVLVNLPIVQALDPELYEQITETSLNRKALNKALRAGRIKPDLARAAMATRPNSPSVRLTRLDEPEPAPGEDDE